MAKSQSNNPHTAFSEIPVIDITGLYSCNFDDRNQVAIQLAKAAREVGFFYLEGHQISQSRVDSLISAARQFFSQPLPVKMQSYIGLSQNHSGYVPEGEERFYSTAFDPSKVDHKESYDLGFDLQERFYQRPMLGPNLWPDLREFKSKVESYYTEALELGNLLFKGFSLALGLPENTLISKVSRPPSQLRLVHYPYDENAVDREGIGAHTDYECFTLLLTTSDGLQVLNGAGDWIDAPHRPGSFIVNIGDMLEILSNGRFVATSHRVRKVKEERFSFPLFCSLDYDTFVEPILPPQAGKDSDKYDGLVCGDHLYAQTIQTFQYLQRRLENGEIALPEASKTLATFGQFKPLMDGARSTGNER
jgi:isopenicillin N synthase-like dioxygenase